MSLRRRLFRAGLYLSSRINCRSTAALFDKVRTYVMFVGYPRSGHSLIGSLLDAHPNVVIAHEMDALQFVQSDFSKEQIFHLLLRNSESMAARGRSHSGYSYAVPNQWQGRFETLQILGDKKGAASAMRLHRTPGLFERLKKTLDTEIKLIHVIRNPYDVLATMRRRSPHKGLDTHVKVFFELCESMKDIKTQIPPQQLFDLELEYFIADPKAHLARLCSFLGVENSEAYLDDCCSIVFASPKKSRQDLAWTDESIAQVKRNISRFEFLSGYSFHDGGEKDLSSAET